jgi:hypothetical protein
VTRIDAMLARGTTTSFEFFPPQTDAGERHLRDALNELEPLGPSFVSVTYGAGGSTRERTHRLVVDVLERTTMTPMAHLTAVNHRREELTAILAAYRDAGVENVLALRGTRRGAAVRMRRSGSSTTPSSSRSSSARSVAVVSPSGSPRTRRVIPCLPTSARTAATSPRSWRSPTSPSRSSSSTSRTTCGWWRSSRRSAATSRSCRGSCRSPTSGRSSGSRSCRGRRSLPTSPSGSTPSSTMPPRCAASASRSRRALRRAVGRRGAGAALLHPQPLDGDAGDPREPGPAARSLRRLTRSWRERRLSGRAAAGWPGAAPSRPRPSAGHRAGTA